MEVCDDNLGLSGRISTCVPYALRQLGLLLGLSFVPSIVHKALSCRQDSRVKQTKERHNGWYSFCGHCSLLLKHCVMPYPLNFKINRFDRSATEYSGYALSS